MTGAVKPMDRLPVSRYFLVFERAPPRRLEKLSGYYAEPGRPQRHLPLLIHQSE